MSDGFTFQGQGKLARIDTFTSKAGKTILTLVFEEGGQYPQMVPIKVFGRLAEMASEWQIGDTLKVTGRLGGRDWNGKVYGDSVATYVEVVEGGAGQHREEHAGGKRQGWDSPPDQDPNNGAETAGDADPSDTIPF